MKRVCLHLTLASIAVAWFSGCSPSQPRLNAQSEPTTAPVDASPEDIWKSLQDRNPYPYTTPLPPPVSTGIDGAYIKWEPMDLLGEHIHCRRCPDWLYEGGLWKIQFDRGVYRVLHVDLGWKSLGSYAVSGDQVLLFNDPNCIEDTGVYRWNMENGVLTFEIVDDPCAILLRGKNLSHLPWQGCQPPDKYTGTGQWQKPQGCD